MIYLDSPNKKIQAVLAGAPATSQPQCTTFYYDVPPVRKDDMSEYRGGTFAVNTNGNTDVDIVAAPMTGSRDVKGIFIFNRDTASVTVTVKLDDSGTESIFLTTVLAPKETLAYEDGSGFYVIAANGAIKNGAGVSGPASSTDNAAVRWDGTTATTIQNSGVIIDDSNNVTGVVALTMSGLLSITNGQILFPATQNPSADANTLDDYEEGTFTATLAGSSAAGAQTYSVQASRYTKTGRNVEFEIMLRMTAKDGATNGNMSVNGLPFTSASSTPRGAVAMGVYANIDLNVAGAQYTLCGEIVGSGTKIDLYQAGDNVAQSAIVAANIGNTTELSVGGNYTAS